MFQICQAHFKVEFINSNSAHKLSPKISDQMTGVLLSVNALFIQPMNRKIISVNFWYRNFRGYPKLQHICCLDNTVIKKIEL